MRIIQTSTRRRCATRVWAHASSQENLGRACGPQDQDNDEKGLEILIVIIVILFAELVVIFFLFIIFEEVFIVIIGFFISL